MAQEISERIAKDIQKFSKSLSDIDGKEMDKRMKEVVELSKMYASDARSYLEKGDYYTSFSCISYAHGLMDSIKMLLGVQTYV
ncbi:MAG: DUF357 domain-containing protein [Candidatus Micrarchaeota archaeon]|nr:DUF357 domain-containing protein [Candidatus Micrarchaeota archaeon]